jgi:hypothetical protein
VAAAALVAGLAGWWGAGLASGPGAAEDGALGQAPSAAPAADPNAPDAAPAPGETAAWFRKFLDENDAPPTSAAHLVARIRTYRPAQGTERQGLDRIRAQFELPALLKQWALIDPEAAVDHMASAIRSGDRRHLQTLDEVIYDWAQRDFPAALRAAEAADSPNIYGSPARKAIEGFARADPAGGWAILAASGENDFGVQRETMVSSLAVELARSDPRRVAEMFFSAQGALVGFRRTVEDQSLSANLALAWARMESPEAVLAWVTSQPESYQVPDDIGDSALDIWISQDAAAAAEWLKSDHGLSLEAGRAVITRAFGDLLRADVALAGEFYQTTHDLDPTTRAALEDQLLAHLARTDPDATMDLVRGESDPEKMGHLFNRLLSETRYREFPGIREKRWAWVQEYLDLTAGRAEGEQGNFWAVGDEVFDQDVSPADLALIATLDAESSARLLPSLSRLPQGSDFPGFAEALGAFPDSSPKDTAVQNVAAAWGAHDPSAAAAWVESLPPGGPRDRAVLNTAAAWAQSDPAAAARWFTDHAGGLPDQPHAVTAIAANLAAIDPAGAVALLATLDNSAAFSVHDARPALLVAASADPQATAEAISRLDPPTRDSLREVVAHLLPPETGG